MGQFSIYCMDLSSINFVRFSVLLMKVHLGCGYPVVSLGVIGRVALLRSVFVIKKLTFTPDLKSTCCGVTSASLHVDHTEGSDTK